MGDLGAKSTYVFKVPEENVLDEYFCGQVNAILKDEVEVIRKNEESGKVDTLIEMDTMNEQ